ncbi:excisionase [Staphylococcus aureus]|uniref:excisionase n=1 Tax=Staphylococcus aureus TaxID=1280 RepID=UPI0021CFA47B|nr:excisionase [Staphylococcus aureus]UXT69850.1 excisionase [Staphylococcus aureus]UXT93860.1 excisionase [Staphylococcus aureus]UXU12179.1 excisionase [Staphylococcus aureus]
MTFKNNHNFNELVVTNEDIRILKNVLEDAVSVYDEYSVCNEESDFAYCLLRDLYTLDSLAISSNNV